MALLPTSWSWISVILLLELAGAHALTQGVNKFRLHLCDCWYAYLKVQKIWYKGCLAFSLHMQGQQENNMKRIISSSFP